MVVEIEVIKEVCNRCSCKSVSSRFSKSMTSSSSSSNNSRKTTYNSSSCSTGKKKRKVGIKSSFSSSRIRSGLRSYKNYFYSH